MQLESKNVNLEAKSMNESRKNEELFFYCLAASFDTLKELNLNGIFNSTQNKSLFFDFLIKILPKTSIIIFFFSPKILKSEELFQKSTHVNQFLLERIMRS